MSLEQVIEADMARFLDGAMTPVEKRDAPRQEDAAYAYANKDWESEIRTLLKRNDLDGAKRLFNELKERYNQTPADHHEERKRLYETIQSCYLQIVNYATDRQRTTELLQHMEQGPSDVFNVNVRSVNLQIDDRNTQPLAGVSGMGHGHPSAAPNIIVVQAPPVQPQAYPSTQQYPPSRPYPSSSVPPQAPAAPSSPYPPAPAPQFIMAAPASMPSPAAQPNAAAGSQPSPGPVSMVNVSTGGPSAQPQVFKQEKSRDEIVSASVRKTLQDAMTLSKSDPGAGLTLLKGIGDTVMNEEQAGRLTHATASLLVGQIESLEHAMRAGEDRHRFAAEFNASLSSLTHLARTKHEDAVFAYESLRQKAESFEKSYPAYAGEFTARLDTVQEQYSLLDEDAIVERLGPLLQRIKIARSQGDRRAMLETLEDLSHFTNTLPHVPERVLLENVVSKLRARALGVRPVAAGVSGYIRPSSTERDERPIL